MPYKSNTSLPDTPESIGKRIARLRSSLHWTQQELAEHLAISRVAVSHIEMDLSIPGERTITLLAGIFKMTPIELVNGSTYPQAKAERLPLVVCSYTPLELDLALMKNDLSWLTKIEDSPNWRVLQSEVIQYWKKRLLKNMDSTYGERQKAPIQAALLQIIQLENNFD